MSNTVHVNDFSGSIANDIYTAGGGDFSMVRQFDLLTYPNRLYPLRSMTGSTANTGIGNIIVGNNGTFYGQGTDVNNPTLDMLYSRNPSGGAGNWTALGVASTGDPVNYNLLVEYPDSSGGTFTIFHAGANVIQAEKPDGTAQSPHSLTFSDIGQGFVHPQYKKLYIPYRSNSTSAWKIAVYDGSIGIPSNAGAWTNVALTLPTSFTGRPVLTSYGNYLAIGCSSNASGSGLNTSMVFFWDTTSTTWNDSIGWGSGTLQVLNNLNGLLVGVSTTSSILTGSVQDYDALLIKVYSGGSPELVKEISVVKQTLTTPSVTINPLVNFIFRNRLYFSADIVGGSTSPVQKGLWVFGKSKNGGYQCMVERFGSTDGIDVSVLAAAIAGDYVAMVHTASGTVTVSWNNSSFATAYASPSVYESVVNPRMGLNRLTRLHPILNKQLQCVAVHYLPIISGGQVVIKYRVDSTGSWTTIFTETTAGAVVTERINVAGVNFTSGRNYEFRLESTGGAQIVGFSYKYELLKTNIL